MANRPPRIDTDRTKEAFAIYLCMGRNRSISGLAARTDVAKRTLQSWTHDLKWEDRVTDYLARYGGFPNEIGKSAVDVMREYLNMSEDYKYPDPSDIAKRLNPQDLMPEFNVHEPLQILDIGAGAMTVMEYRALLGTLVRDFANSFKNGNIRVNNIYEFEKIVKLDLMLLTGTSGRGNQTNVQLNITGDTNTNIRLESIIQDNPKVQDLVGELWREYNAKSDTTRPSGGYDVNGESESESNWGAEYTSGPEEFTE